MAVTYNGLECAVQAILGHSDDVGKFGLTIIPIDSTAFNDEEEGWNEVIGTRTLHTETIYAPKSIKVFPDIENAVSSDYCRSGYKPLVEKRVLLQRQKQSQVGVNVHQHTWIGII